MRVDLVPQQDVDSVWPSIFERIIQCAERQDTDCSPSDLYVRCRAGTAFLAVVRQGEDVIGFSIGGFETWTRGTVFVIYIMAGTGMKRWQDDIKRLGIDLARFGGATRIAWSGRKGWERFEPMAKVASVRMVMEI